MCVIVVKFKGADFPSKQVITACMQANPHGFAAAWNEDGQLKTFKTMNADEMLAQYDHIRHLDPAATGLVLHARIMTHGTVSLKNCHCWTNGDGTMAFAHNGVLSSVEVDRANDMTDSESFFRNYFLPVYEHCSREVAWRVADMAAKGNHSRLAFILADGEIKIFGGFSKKEEEGHKGMVYYSNMNWDNYIRRSRWAFDERAKKGAGKGSVVSTRDEMGRIISVTAKDLLKKEYPQMPARKVSDDTQKEIPFWTPHGGLFK